MNRETPEETGIYLLSSSLPQHCLYTRLSSLQKLRVRIVNIYSISLSVLDFGAGPNWRKYRVLDPANIMVNLRSETGELIGA